MEVQNTFIEVNRDSVLQYLKKNSTYLKSTFHLTKLGLIGSFAREEQKENSDIDLLVEFEDGTQELYDLKRELVKHLRLHFHRNIDICREKYIKPHIKEYLLKDYIHVA